MRRSADFAAVIRGGSRAGASTLVVHQRYAIRDDQNAPLIGFVVSRAVGGSVVRHRVSRRLRAQVAQRLATFPAASATVVRALPAAATATSNGLGADLDVALARAGAAGRGRRR